jgi:hypothetical protein
MSIGHTNRALLPLLLLPPDAFVRPAPGRCDIDPTRGACAELANAQSTFGTWTLKMPLPAPRTVVGVGDFYGTGTDDILFRNNSTGDMWFAGMSNGAFNGWHQVGGSDTTYSALGVVDYFGNRTADILFRNNSTGDTWYAAMSNGGFNSWQHIGGSDPTYGVKT